MAATSCGSLASDARLTGQATGSGTADTADPADTTDPADAADPADTGEPAEDRAGTSGRDTMEEKCERTRSSVGSSAGVQWTLRCRYRVSRWAGMRPAVRIRAIRSCRLDRCRAPAEEITFSSSMIDPRSSTPMCRDNWPTSLPVVSHDDCRWATLSKNNRATQTNRRYSSEVAWVRPLRWLFSAWYVHGMNDRKPPVRSCTSRIIRRCSMRSALVSPVPIIMVAVDSIPCRWAVSITSSQRSPYSLSGAIAVRGRAGNISAPAPAIESRPAALIRRTASSMETPDTLAMCRISLGPIEWITNCGYAALTALNM